MKKSVKWIVALLIISGWIAFIIQRAVSEKEKAMLNTKLTQIESEINAYQFLVKDVKASSEKVDNMISVLENLKTNLDKLKLKMDKGVKNESSQNGE